MAVPKSKISPSRRGMRRSHDALKSPMVAFDPETGESKLPHHVSMVDGTYRGRKVFMTRAEKRMQKKAQEMQEAENSQAEESKEGDK